MVSYNKIREMFVVLFGVFGTVVLRVRFSGGKDQSHVEFEAASASPRSAFQIAKSRFLLPLAFAPSPELAAKDKVRIALP